MSKKIKLSIEVQEERIENMMASIEYGASNYWLDALTPKYSLGVGAVKLPFEKVALGEHSLVRVKYENPNSGPDFLTFDLNRAACIKGLEVMANKYPKHFADLTSENDDADTADVWLQCCIFGEIIYG